MYVKGTTISVPANTWHSLQAGIAGLCMYVIRSDAGRTITFHKCQKAPNSIKIAE